MGLTSSLWKTYFQEQNEDKRNLKPEGSCFLWTLGKVVREEDDPRTRFATLDLSLLHDPGGRHLVSNATTAPSTDTHPNTCSHTHIITAHGQNSRSRYCEVVSNSPAERRVCPIHIEIAENKNPAEAGFNL